MDTALAEHATKPKPKEIVDDWLYGPLSLEEAKQRFIKQGFPLSVEGLYLISIRDELAESTPEQFILTLTYVIVTSQVYLGLQSL